VIEENAQTPHYEPPAKEGSSLEYGSGDWGRYVIEPRYRLLLDRMEAETTLSRKRTTST
jgi:hypothetical protein